MISRLALPILLTATVAAAHADPFNFTNWSTATQQNGVKVSGTIPTAQGSVGVTLTGGFTDLYKNADHYRPAASWTGGIVGNAPDVTDLIRVDNAGAYTLTFTKPVTNVALDLWSVGGGSTGVTYDFGAQPFSLVAGGANAEYGGGALTKSGNAVTGVEGNGTLLFTGTYSTISWNVIGNETYHGFTVGLGNAQPVPEPSAFAALGLGAFGLLRRRKRA